MDDNTINNNAINLNEMAQYNLTDLLEDYSFIEKWQRVFEGLNYPHDTGEYKWAKFQILRLWAPAAGITVPLLALLVMMLFSFASPPDRLPVEVLIADPEIIEKLEDIKPIEEKIEIIDPIIVETDIISDTPSEFRGPDTTPGNPEPFSPQPAAFDSVAFVKSPLILKGVYGSRNPGQRGGLLGNHGGGSGTEDAVLKALRWLKKYQESDGSWDTKSGGYNDGQHYPSKTAMTGLALLTYLAHGETPTSTEFGQTVERAIRYLVDNQRKDGKFPNEGDSHEYGHPIATYALCESFGMTQIPMVKDAAERAVDIIVKGQHGCGLWNYNCDASDRNDISYSGWCAQALKASKMAEIKNDQLDMALKKAASGFKSAYRNGPFAYELKDGNGGNLASAAVLCLQLLGEGKAQETKSGMDWMNQNATFNWQVPWGNNPIYYWYYLTQSKFHVGGDTWNKWNKQFSPQLIKQQIVMKGAGIDGKDIGYWQGLDGLCKSYVYNTTLCALMLEVYYRYLPTFKPLDETKEEDKEEKSGIDVKVNI